MTAKFAIQLVAPNTTRAAPRTRMGNISPSSTHITGPHDIAKDELEGRICQGAGAGRSLGGVLGMGDGRPAEDHQNGDDDVDSPYCQVH